MLSMGLLSSLLESEMDNEVLDIEKDSLGLSELDDLIESILRNGTGISAGLEEAKEIRITSDAHADHWIERANAIQEEIESVKEITKVKIQQKKEAYESWRDKRINTLQNELEFYEHHLQNYAQEKLQDSRKKSYNLPSGTIGFRKNAQSIDIKDKDAIFDFAMENELDGIIRIKKELDVSKVKKEIQLVDDRYMLMGTDVTEYVESIPEQQKFYIKH